MCQHRFIDDDKCPTPVGDVDNGGCCECIGDGSYGTLQSLTSGLSLPTGWAQVSSLSGALEGVCVGQDPPPAGWVGICVSPSGTPQS